MYPAQLANRYLTSRIIPLIAVAAVALCVALVVIVVSVMSGFLDLLRASGRTLIGDVIITCPVRGIPWYGELIADIEAMPETAAATPVIDTYGLVRMPYPEGSEKDIVTANVWGIEPHSFNRVTDYARALYWKPPASPEAAAAMQPDDPRLQLKKTIEQDGLDLVQHDTGDPGLVLGMHVSMANDRRRDGSYKPRFQWFMPRYTVTLTLVPISAKGTIAEPRERAFPIVNEFRSGVYQIDKNRVMIPLAEAQKLLRMDEGTLYDMNAPPQPDGSLPILGVSPAKVSKVLVRAKPGVTPDQLRDAVAAVYDKFSRDIAVDPSKTVKAPMTGYVSILTWEQQLRDLIGPVEKEREMMRILFSIVYLVCAGLVLSIFWAIVQEKTRDVGILRSVGASRPGILWIFLQYGLVIGAVGGLAGIGVGWLVIRNINSIHEAIGQDAPRWSWIACFAMALASFVLSVRGALAGVLLRTLLWTVTGSTLVLVGVLLTLHRGTLIWDPSVYYFDHIPDQVDWFTAMITWCGAVVFSVLGASIPAAKAADIHPVRALRYE
ncbi:MAG: FtsX-like permease family protein [Planctomycetes bacterium]|nr:FtsX-like permease family protein [Planctomycetota bacterium]